MEAITIKAKRTLELGDVPGPVPVSGEVLVRVKASGICGTDVHVYEGEVPLAKFPVIPGHEFCGVVESLGPGVEEKDVAVGDRVAIEPNLFCGRCHYCRNAKKHFCENWGAVGLTKSGGFAELCTVPLQAVYKMAPSLSFKQGAFFEPVACVLHGIERSGVRPGDSVVLQGAGSIGLIYVQVLKAIGVKTVIVSDMDDAKLDVAKRLGASAIVNASTGNLVETVMDITGGVGVEVAIDAAGAPASISSCFDVVQDTGTIVIFGVPPEDTRLPVNLFDVYRRELTIVGSFTNPYTNEQALDVLAAGQVDVGPVVTHEIGLADVEETMLKIRDRKDAVIKAQITF